MQVKLFIDKSLEENAGIYFDCSKKAKSKLKGAKEALQNSLINRERILKDTEKKEEQIAKQTTGPKKWYHKFRWFKTSDGYLCIGGRDATTNDLVIKKHTDSKDLVFHTERPGSPFFIIKARGGEDGKLLVGNSFPKTSKEEAARACVTFSKAWKRQLGSDEVYCVAPEQLKKEMGLPKGTFMVYGRREFFTAPVDLCVGRTDSDEIMAGPQSAIKKHCKNYFVVVQGDSKVSTVAKKILKRIGGELDTIIRVFPGGTFKLHKLVGDDVK